MSIAKHTPGPWNYQEEADAYTHIVRGPANEFICSGPQDSSGRARADMKLAAMAPVLLKSLKELESISGEANIPMETSKAVRQMARFIKARECAAQIIAKVEGAK